MTERPLRVLHVLAELKPSGAETMLRAAGPEFIARGVRGDILATGTELGSFAHALSSAGFCLHHIPFRKSPGFFIDVWRLMRSGEYDVIHLHTERANFWFGIVAKISGVKRVLRTIHNAFAFKGVLRWRRKWQRLALHSMGITHVAISESVRETESSCYALPTRVVANWYDSKKFNPPSDKERRDAKASFGLRDEDTAIVTIGNCSVVKNHGALIEAMASLPIERQPVYLHVGIEESDQPERRLAERLGVAKQIRFLGALNDVLPALHAADIFIMPSLYEGFGISAVEALATGLPALFADVAGLKDFRKNYEGLCYTAPDASSLKLVLTEMLAEDFSVRRARAEEYPEISRRLFGMARGVQDYIQLYREP